MKKRIIFIIAVVALVAIGCGIWYFVRHHGNPSAAVACTQEAMQCSDGSFVGRMGPNCEFAQCPVATSTVDTSRWKSFVSNDLGVSLKYPADWKVNGALGEQTLLRIGHPLSGMVIYDMTVEIQDNPQGLSPSAFVAQMLADDAAEDVKNGAPTASPPITPSFDHQFNLAVSDISAYELYRVFRFDEHTEQIYVQHGTTMIVFEFPVAEANPNLSEPVANNAVAHEIVNTLILEK